MPSTPLVIRAGAALVDGRLQPAVVTVAGGRVTAVATGADVPQAGRTPPPGAEVVDVPPGTYLLPGVVDTHVHLNEPGRTHWEGFATATEAAARGGVTTLVDMPLNSVPPTTDPDALRVKQEAAEHQLRVDVGFWGGAVPGNLHEFEPLWEAGVFGFKGFLVDSGVPEFPPLTEDDLGAVMAEIARLSALFVVHAEDAAEIAAADAPPSPRFRDFLRSRPDAAEVVAVTRLVRGMREHGTRTHVLHLSSARALDVVAEARAEGLPLTVETCPHYLVLDVDELPDGAAEFKCCPPIRDAGNREALWAALDAGVVDCVVSDHSPSSPAEKGRGDGDLQQAWGGISGLQVGFGVVVDEARRRGLDVDRVSGWMSAAPAALVGLDAKGRIAVGRDADLVWYDPERDLTVSADLLAHRHRQSAWTGRTVHGSVSRTLLRGEPVFDATAVVPRADTGAPRGRRLTRDARG